MTPTQIFRCSILAFACAGLFSCKFNEAWCDAPIPVVSEAGAPSAASVVYVNAMRIEEIKEDPALKAKVSFTAESLPLSDLLKTLQAQNNLVLIISPKNPVINARVTAYVQALPLAQVLLGLSRMYGVRWEKTTNDTFTMLPTDKGHLETGLLHLGDMDEFRSRFITALRHQTNAPNWPQEVMKYVQEGDFADGKSVPISVLPPELQTRIRKEKEELAGLQMVSEQQMAMEASMDDDILWAKVPEERKLLGGQANQEVPHIGLLTKKGNPVAQLPQPMPKMNQKAPTPDNSPVIPDFARHTK